MNKLIGTTIGLALSIIVLASILMPVLNEATTTHTTFENESYYALDKITEDTEVSLKWEKTTPGVILINDVPFTMPADLPSGRAYTIVGSETAIVRYYINVGGAPLIEFASGSSYVNINVNDTSTYALATISGYSLTFYADLTSPYSITTTLSGDSYHLAGSTGNYTEVMKDSSSPAYVNGDSVVHLIGTTTPVVVGTYGIGSIDDGLTLSTLYKKTTITSDVTYSTPVTTYTAVDGYEDLYLLEKFDFNITYDDTTQAATYTYFIIPAEVTAEKSVHFTDGENALLNVLPIMIIVGIVMAAISLVVLRRD